jgi:hypothetical protein
MHRTIGWRKSHYKTIFDEKSHYKTDLQKGKRKERKNALQYHAATGPSTIVLEPALPAHAAVVVAHDHWGVVCRVAARDGKRVVSAAP